MAVKKLKAKLSRLEDITLILEGENQEIEASIKLFEEGMKLVKECTGDLDSLEGKILVLVDGEEKDFEGRIV